MAYVENLNVGQSELSIVNIPGSINSAEFPLVDEEICFFIISHMTRFQSVTVDRY